MTIREFFENNIPDSEGRVPVILFRDLDLGVDISLYLCFNDSENWFLYDNRNDKQISAQPDRELLPLVSTWLEEQFWEQSHALELDLSECYNEILGQLQSTNYAVNLEYTNLISVLRNTERELEQEGMQTSFTPEPTTTIQPPPVDVLLITNQNKCDHLSTLLHSNNISYWQVSTVKDALEFCKTQNPSVVFWDTTTTQPTKPSALQNFASYTNKLIALVSNNTPNEEFIVELADDTYSSPIDNQTFLRSLNRYLNLEPHIQQNQTIRSQSKSIIDVLLVYPPETSQTIQETLERFEISFVSVLTIPEAITYCEHKTPTIILVDAKQLPRTQVKAMKSLREYLPQTSKIFACITESSPHQNTIISLSTHIFPVPVRTSEIMKRILSYI